MGSATTDSEGRYQVPINSSGAFWIVARELSYGIAFSPTIQLDPSRDTQAPDLVLRPEGVIAGAVVYADGTPCRDLRLTYWWSEALPPDPLVPQKWPAELVENKYIGHGLRTDKHGRFRIAGLRRGRYKITLKGGSKAEKTRYFATGTLDARIVIGLQRLRVRVMDGAGGPLCYSDVSWVVWSPDEAAEAERRFQDGEFMAEVLDSRQASGGSNTSGPRAEKEFLAAAGSFWLFQAVIPGCAPATAGIRVRSRPGEHETVIPLVLARCANTGTVRIELTDSAGSPIRKYRARLQHPVTGSGVAWLDRTYKEGPDIFDAVAPGRYRLEVKPGGSVTNLVPYFPIVREVRVTGGQESLVKLQPPAGGRVRITLRVSGEQPRRLTNFKLRAVFEGGRKRPILGPYVYKTKTGWEGGWRATPGESFLCRRLLEPGRHTLYFEADGHQPKQVVVKIEAGKTVDLEVWLIPR